MTISEAITHINTVKPNAYGNSEKLKWLYTLDLLIKANILDLYTEEVEDIDDYTELTTEEQAEVELLVPAPWDIIYEHYMAGEIDRLNEEIDLYNNDTLKYNETLSEFRNNYNRTHTAKASRIKRL